MGEVYVAEDTKLDRKIALKVLPPDLAESAERRARFEREAKTIAALNHPNIVTVHSVEESEGVHFITMELVRGKTLTELLPAKGLPLNKFFEIATPLADAVAAAHDKGITHRDIKPDNIMVSDEGRIKVLDFGLAKPGGGFAPEDANSDRATAAKTSTGSIVGMLHYMSPEQAQGESVDHRSGHLFTRRRVLRDGVRPASFRRPKPHFGSLVHPQGHAHSSRRAQPEDPAGSGEADPAMSGQGSDPPFPEHPRRAERARGVQARGGLGGRASGFRGPPGRCSVAMA